MSILNSINERSAKMNLHRAIDGHDCLLCMRCHGAIEMPIYIAAASAKQDFVVRCLYIVAIINADLDCNALQA